MEILTGCIHIFVYIKVSMYKASEGQNRDSRRFSSIVGFFRYTI
jgi:hypothetical protein